MSALSIDWRKYLTPDEFEEEAELGREVAKLARQANDLNDRVSALRAVRRALEIKARSRARYAKRKSRAAMAAEQRSEP
jgi:hypothetical protein